MRDSVNKAAQIVVNRCLANGLSKIVFGWNIGQKDSAGMGAKTNQKFVQTTIGAKPDGWKESGRRVKRGLYRTGLLNWCINADCNGAANILRKVATMLGLCLKGVGRGALAAPQRIKL